MTKTVEHDLGHGTAAVGSLAGRFVINRLCEAGQGAIAILMSVRKTKGVDEVSGRLTNGRSAFSFAASAGVSGRSRFGGGKLIAAIWSEWMLAGGSIIVVPRSSV